MQFNEEKIEDSLMDSLLREQVRSDRERAFREIENAIMTDVVHHIKTQPVVDWKRMLVAGSIAATIVLGFGYALSFVILPPSGSEVPMVETYSFETSPAEHAAVAGSTSRKPRPIGSLPNIVRSTIPYVVPGPGEQLFPEMIDGQPSGLMVTADPVVGLPGGQPSNQVRRGSLVDQVWSSPMEKPFSTFAVDVSSASYTDICRMIREGRSIPKDAVRIEECVNAFQYQYDPPTNGATFAVHANLTTCPWNDEHVLVKVGIKGREIESSSAAGSTSATIAKDVNIQVEFNPQRVGSYRLIGYANSIPSADGMSMDKVEAGDIAAGHMVTAFYEVTPAKGKQVTLTKISPLKYQRVGTNQEVTGPSDEWLTLKLRHSNPQGQLSSPQECVLKGSPLLWQHASSDYRFATAVTLFGMKLRGMSDVSGISWQQIAEIAETASGDGTDKQRAEFIQLVHTLGANGDR